MNKIKKILPIILAFVLVFGSCLTVSASNMESFSLTKLREIAYTWYSSQGYESYAPESYSGYCCYKSDSDNIVIFCTVNGFQISEYNAAEYSLVNSNGGSVFKINYNISNNTYSAIGEKGIFNKSFMDSFYSTLDIYNRNEDTIFFQRPVTPVELALEELPETVNSQTAVILTIAIACLALLITLSVLRKKLPIFLH